MNSIMSAKWFAPLVIVGILAVSLLAIIPIFSSNFNRAVTLEENINTAKSNINKEEQRRVDLFNNLADAVSSAKKFEQSTQTKIAEARSQAKGGNVDQAMMTIAAVAEAYPEIKSIALYDKTMIEFSVTENRIAGYREQYNNDVRSYNRKVRGFPSNMILGIMGYERKDFKYLEYDVPSEGHRNLFDE